MTALLLPRVPLREEPRSLVRDRARRRTRILGGAMSLFVTRPSLAAYTATRAELLQRANEVLGWVSSGRLKVKVDSTFKLAEASGAHARLESRASSGKILLVP